MVDDYSAHVRADVWHNWGVQVACRMARKKNYYQVLGVEANVPPEEIKRAYRKLAKTQHPDLHASSGNGNAEHAHERMMELNEAYETLSDAQKRAVYDCKIGVSSSITVAVGPQMSSLDEDIQREKFLRAVFHPARSSINRVLSSYKKQLRQLSADPYDDLLVEEFQQYVDKIEEALRKGSDGFSRNEAPRSLEAAVHMMRHAIAQAADGLDEIKHYLNNYDYNHLTMAESLFRIAGDLSRQSLDLTKGR